MLESNSRVTVTVNIAGTPIDLGIWTTKTGGQVEADDTKFRPGNMAKQISLGGPVSVENVVVSKLYDDSMRSQVKTLMNNVGRATMNVSYQPLDKNGVAFGNGKLTYTGTLNRVTPPDADANSNDAAMIELELSAESEVG